MTKKEKLAFDKSYHAYKRDWYNWKNKGYTMEDEAPLNKKEYQSIFSAAKKAGMKNIAVETAKSSRLMTHQEALTFRESLEKQVGKDKTFDTWFNKQAKTAKQLLGSIGKFEYSIGADKYTGKQGLYIALKELFDSTVANEAYGY